MQRALNNCKQSMPGNGKELLKKSNAILPLEPAYLCLAIVGGIFAGVNGLFIRYIFLSSWFYAFWLTAVGSRCRLAVSHLLLGRLLGAALYTVALAIGLILCLWVWRPHYSLEFGFGGVAFKYLPSSAVGSCILGAFIGWRNEVFDEDHVQI